MTKVYTYIPPKIKDKAKVDISHLASKEELKDGIQEAKNYTNEEIAKAQLGGSGEVDLSAYATKTYVDNEISKI